MLTATNTVIFNGRDFNIGHGVYMPTLRMPAMSAAMTDATAYLLLWFPEKLDAYPLWSDVVGGRQAVSPNGGVKVDLDYPEVATFGFYKVQAKSPKLSYWADFDHWPMEGGHLKNGLANGHYHKASDKAVQIPVTDAHRGLLVRLCSHVRGGGFGG